MATMEKITFPPLIAHLQLQQDFFNQLCRGYEMKYGVLPSGRLASWMVGVVEPIMMDMEKDHAAQSLTILQRLFAELLKVMAIASRVSLEQEYQSAWLLVRHIPKLFVEEPVRLLKAITSAVDSIRIYQRDQVGTWIKYMKQVAIHCLTVEEFLRCGRICAWMVGLTHLRSKAKESVLGLNADLKSQFNTFITPNDIMLALEHEWFNLQTAEFVGEAGGYIGLDGPFEAAPLVALIEGQILLTDQKNTHALFADSFGKVIISEIPIAHETIFKNAKLLGWWDFRKKYGDSLICFEDVSSAVMTSNTLVLTRTGSHYVYIFGIPA